MSSARKIRSIILGVITISLVLLAAIFLTENVSSKNNDGQQQPAVSVQNTQNSNDNQIESDQNEIAI